MKRLIMTRAINCLTALTEMTNYRLGGNSLAAIIISAYEYYTNPNLSTKSKVIKPSKKLSLYQTNPIQRLVIFFLGSKFSCDFHILQNKGIRI